MYEDDIVRGVVDGLRKQGLLLVRRPVAEDWPDNQTFTTTFTLEGACDGRLVKAEMRVSQQVIAQAKFNIRSEIKRSLDIHYGKALMEILHP